MTRQRGAALAGLLGVAILIAYVVSASGAQPGYDTSWHLVWAKQILSGHSPTFNTWAAPTEHPLLVAIALVAALVGGSSSGPLMVGFTLLALVALLVEMRRLGQAVFGSGASGIIGWALLAGAYGLLLQSLRGYLDVWFLLLVTVAAVRIAEQKRAGAGWLALLLAGLLRPEAWLLAGIAAAVSWRNADRGSRIRSFAAVIAPPVIWFGLDTLVTGHPLLSFETAKALEVKGNGGPFHVLAVTLAGGLRSPATLLGLLGLALAWRRLGLRQIALPLVLVGAGLGMALAIGIAGLTLLPRYLLLCDLGLVFFGGYALAGWTAEKPTPKWWRAGGIIVMGLGTLVLTWLAMFSVSNWPGVNPVSKFRYEIALDKRAHWGLSQALNTATVRRALKCGPLTFPSYRLIPDAKLILDNPNADVRARAQLPKPTTGVAIEISHGDSDGEWGFADRFILSGTALPTDLAIPPNFKWTALGGAQEPNGTRHSEYFIAFTRCPGQKLSR